MDKMLTAGIVVVVLVIIVGIAIFSLMGGSKAPASSTTLVTTQYYSNATTTVTTLPNNSSLSNVTKGCAATTYYGCNNASYSIVNGNASLKVTISQNTGQLWSGYGIGYAPVNSSSSGGVPKIVFYTNATGGSNAGSSLPSGVPVTLVIPTLGTNTTTVGALWACYVNSGVLYVGNGCTPQAGVAATYVEIAKLNLTS